MGENCINIISKFIVKKFNLAIIPHRKSYTNFNGVTQVKKCELTNKFEDGSIHMYIYIYNVRSPIKKITIKIYVCF